MTCKRAPATPTPMSLSFRINYTVKWKENQTNTRDSVDRNPFIDIHLETLLPLSVSISIILGHLLLPNAGPILRRLLRDTTAINALIRVAL